MGFTIGDIKLKNKVVAAPMAGISDKAFRIMAASYGCGLTFSEMISDQGLIYEQVRTLGMLDVAGESVPTVVQIFGSEPENMARAASIAEERGAQIIDINMGCPTPKIVKNGEGCALMRDLSQAQKVIQAVVKAVTRPVTIKMRKGWDEGHVNCFELARIAEGEGVQALTIHPRTREQFFSGKADWEIIRKVKQTVSIPVIGNGDIFDALDARMMLDETGCDAVMIGRGALGNPFIYQATAVVLDGEEALPSPSIDERLAAAMKHCDLVMGFKGERGIIEMRKHLGWYIKGLPNATKSRQLINQATSRDEIMDIMQTIGAH